MRKVDFLMLKKHGNYTVNFYYSGYKQVGSRDLPWVGVIWHTLFILYMKNIIAVGFSQPFVH
jgi:hypothetical protein